MPGLRELREAICFKLKRDNHLDYQPAEIIVSAGCKQALCNVIASLFDEGDEVIIPAPYWVSYPDMVLLADGVPVFVECPERAGFKLAPQDLDAAITPEWVDEVRWLAGFRAQQLRERPQVSWCAASCHDEDELKCAEQLGCDFVLLSPVLPTQSHPGAPILGWEKFAAIAAASSIPVYALGGL